MRYPQKKGLGKKRDSFESCSVWKGGNDLPWKRKGLPGVPGKRGSCTD